MALIFVTGAAGYVGRRLVRALGARGSRVVALVRDPASLPADLRSLPGVEFVAGDLLEPASYEKALGGCSRVVHLAATTGKARPAVHERTNAEGTRTLLDAARRAGVGGFLHVSTIAVKFRDQRHYPYARSKVRAEEIVRASGVPFTIVRPTIVVGPDSPVVAGLGKLAGLPLVPVFGPGTARVQPISVDDVVLDLAEIVATDRFRGETIDLGGPEVVTIEELLRRIRSAAGKGRARVMHVPLGPVRAALALVEPLLLPVMPLTAGQLATFAEDGVAEPSDFAASRKRPLVGLDAALAGAKREAESDGTIRREFSVFGRYLVGRDPGASALAHYERWHAAHGNAEFASAPPIDRVLVAIARIHPIATRIADAYCARLRRASLLRRKLVLVLALIECSSETYTLVEEPRSSSRAGAWARLVASGAIEGLAFVAGAIVLFPLHAVLGLARRAP